MLQCLCEEIRYFTHYDFVLDTFFYLYHSTGLGILDHLFVDEIVALTKSIVLLSDVMVHTYQHKRDKH